MDICIYWLDEVEKEEIKWIFAFILQRAFLNCGRTFGSSDDAEIAQDCGSSYISFEGAEKERISLLNLIENKKTSRGR
ncbi:hypothetical protein GCM10007362_05580 [Saccharibacillus endophyticus]|uniref:Uncharacterized protein n=1 Tax=Saccharibacillus endophyticus TaxID=2060666 RepID=A0ABQ1ZNP1_9BACL|nr:hypothetical protein GCM10007362_05580 [Saccharibacillus endophyticus]